ncbi:50S ribosomal protein L19e [Candidatus Micrarchaeota archaeon]|nr:50S ribosomal protein L19e [Candidatus Micrarchaeota archaeon]
MSLQTVKRLAAQIMNVGVNKVRINPLDINRATEALTREDVRNLIKDKAVYKLPKSGRRKKEKKKHVGHGRRRGTKNARTPRKEDWMQRVRSQRKYLKQLVQEGNLDKTKKHPIYMKIKSGLFKSRKSLYLYLKDNSLLKKER